MDSRSPIFRSSAKAPYSAPRGLAAAITVYRTPPMATLRRRKASSARSPPDASAGASRRSASSVPMTMAFSRGRPASTRKVRPNMPRTPRRISCRALSIVGASPSAATTAGRDSR